MILHINLDIKSNDVFSAFECLEGGKFWDLIGCWQTQSWQNIRSPHYRSILQKISTKSAGQFEMLRSPLPISSLIGENEP